MGMKEEAGKLMRRAEAIRQKFNETFWFDEKSTFYLALAGNKKPCNIVASNPGHCLFSGIATMEHARDVAKSLLSGNMFTGWGIRTLSSEELRYNPMSYHNGSVWPHDNALIAFGLSRYGLKEEVKTIAAGLFDASLHMDGQRLPELFCGFRRRPGEGPTAYPVACSPQAWSVASVFMVVQALLGLEIDEPGEIIRFYRPVLPAFIDWLEIKNLKFKNQHINIECVKTTENVNIGLLNKDNSVRLEINY
jgi:glycogen debranching enzyme